MGRLAEHRGAVASAAVISTVALTCAFIFFRQRRRLAKHSRPGCLEEVEKPQRSFRRVLADRSLTPFVHLRNEDGGNDFSHPYEARIRAILENPALNFAFMQPTYKEPPGIQAPVEWITTAEELEALAQTLSRETEFAVDTEQHSIHSFHGFTALVQISTGKKDYLVDCIALHDSMGILRPVFANSAICKVFHGADSDVLWLQRDFHIYIVNMFDTAKACLILRKAQRSLAYLLQIYCCVETNKAFQLADWRLRPLPDDMVQYARTDVHYLLYIAHRLCAELLDDNLEYGDQVVDAGMEGRVCGLLLEQSLHRSNLTCLQLYEKEGVSASPSSTSMTLITRFYNGLVAHLREVDEQFLNLVTGLCQWRDHVARIEDESLRSVLSDTALMALATSRPSTPELIHATISAADASVQVPELDAVAMIPSLVSPSRFVGRHMSSLQNVIQGSNADKGYHEDEEDVTSERTWEYNMPKRWRGGSEKSRLQFVKKFSCKAPVYHNCRIYANDGRLLCFCDRKKLEWYVRRGLAEVVQKDPPSVRLLFEPKGRPEDEGNDFYVQTKLNQCVGCGESSHYLRYRIIPSCYRQHFPEHLKSHRSHDIVLLCVDCHEIAHKEAEKHKRQIANKYGVPLFAKVVDSEALVGDKTKSGFFHGGKAGVSSLQLKNAAMALLRHGLIIPTRRRLELEEIVRAYYGKDGKEDISQQDLQEILLVTMRPYELRRFWRRSSRKGDCSEGTVAEGASSNAWEGGGNEFSTNQADSIPSLQDGRENSSEAEPKLLEGRTSMVHLMHLGSIGVKYNTSCESKMEDVANKRLENLPGQVKGHKHKSFLGHETHGRKVVEILMKEGDDGIRNFCQQWRRVFVDALHPAFLPLGWDVFHSGRREFGDFSVYKLPEGNGPGKY